MGEEASLKNCDFFLKFSQSPDGILGLDAHLLLYIHYTVWPLVTTMIFRSATHEAQNYKQEMEQSAKKNRKGKKRSKSKTGRNF